MEPVDDHWARNFKNVTIKIKDGTVITGKLNTGEYPTVSDLFRQSLDQIYCVV